MQGNKTRIIIIIMILMTFLLVFLFGSIALEDSEIVENLQVHRSNYTYDIETYLPSDYSFSSQKYPCNYTLSGNFLFGGSEKSSGIFNEKTIIHLKHRGFYILTISMMDQNSTISAPFIEGKIHGISLPIALSPNTMYLLIIFLAFLFSIADHGRYLQGSNSAVKISSILLWIRSLLFNIHQQRLSSGKGVDDFIKTLNGDIDTYRHVLVESIKISHYIRDNITQIPFCNLNDKINEAIPDNKSQEKVGRIRAALMSISVCELSKEGMEQALKFNPSYLYLPLEYIYANIAKKVYIPRSQELLSRYDINIFKDSKIQLEKINSLIKLDETYIGVLTTIIVGVLAFFGASIMTINRIPLLFKGAIILYLSLNIFMSVLYYISIRKRGNRF